MKEEQRIELDFLLNKTVFWKSQQYVLKSYKTVTSTVVLTTDSNKIVLCVKNELQQFLKMNRLPLKETFTKSLNVFEATRVNNPEISKPVEYLEDYKSVLVTQNDSSAIEQALLNVLQQVQADEKNIPKAIAVCNIVDSAVKVERTKLEINKYLDKKNER